MSMQRLTELLNSELVDRRFLADIPQRKKKPDWVMKESLISGGHL